MFRLICVLCVFLFSTPPSHSPLVFFGHPALPIKKSGQSEQTIRGNLESDKNGYCGGFWENWGKKLEDHTTGKNQKKGVLKNNPYELWCDESDARRLGGKKKNIQIQIMEFIKWSSLNVCVG